jgi:PAS domain S-box-containing protein
VDKRFEQIQSYLIQLAIGDYNGQIPPSESLDEIDALIVGVNMLGEELKVSREKHVALFEHAGDAILIYSAELNKFVDSNEMATVLLGFNKEDIRLLSIVDLFPKGEKTRIASKVTYLKSVIQTSFDTQIETSTGELKYVSFLSKKLPYGENNYFQISLRDITESKLISNNLLRRNVELSNAQKEIVQLSKFPSENPNPIVRFDKNMKLAYNNLASTVNFLSDFQIIENAVNDRGLKKLLNKTKLTGNTETFIETRNKRHYSLTLVYVQEFNYLNVYGADITDFINEANEKEKSLIGLKDVIESQKEFYEFILNSIPSDIAVFDKNHRYLFINPQGIEDEKVRKFMIGKDDFDYVKLKGVSDEKAVARRKLFNKIIRTKNDETWSDEFIDKKGSRKVVQRNMGPIFDEKGKLRYIIGYGTDITKRVLTEEENMKLSFVAKNTNNGVLMLNENREITWANVSFLNRSGYSLNELTGRSATDFLFEGAGVSTLNKVSVSLENQTRVSVELMHRSKEGIEYWVDLNIQPLLDITNKLTGFMFVEFDITDRIINEQTIQNLNVNLEGIVQEKTKEIRVHEVELQRLLSKEKNRTIALRTSEKKLKVSLLKEKELGQLKSSFVSTASHQFRTPLAIIQSNVGLLEMFANKTSKEELDRHTKVTGRITGAITKMTELMDNVLILGKLTSGNVHYNPKSLNVVEFCDQLVAEFNDVPAEGRTINAVTIGEPYNVYLDPKLLTQVLANLINNAFKYSLGKKNPELVIDFSTKELVISIKDCGIGIPKAEISNLFQPFFRANNVTEINGTGLGLSIAKEYVEINKGRIAVQSILGEGSCFKISFKKHTL